MTGSRAAAIAVAVAAVLAAFAAALTLGTRDVPFAAALGAIVAATLGQEPSDPATSAIVVDLRLPRAAGMFAVGALLAAAGTLLQLVLATPLADPYVLGASGGAGVGALLALWAGTSTLVAPAAFAGALAATALTLSVGRSIGGGPVHLLLSGLCVSALTGAAMGMLLLGSTATSRGAAPALAWLLGGVVPSSWPAIVTAWGALGLLVLAALLLGVRVDALTLGDADAAALGVPAGRVLGLVVALAALATAAAVSLAGLVGFVGALVPIAVRALVPSGARSAVPIAALVGGAALLAIDTCARTLLAPLELPTGVVAACIGAPAVLFLVRGEAVTRARI